MENCILEYLLALQNICFVNGKAIQMWFYTNGTHLKLVSAELTAKEQVHLFQNHLDFQMYLDRPSICSKNKILLWTTCFTFLVVSSCHIDSLSITRIPTCSAVPLLAVSGGKAEGDEFPAKQLQWPQLIPPQSVSWNQINRPDPCPAV